MLNVCIRLWNRINITAYIATGLPGPATADPVKIDSVFGNTETLRCSVIDSGNPSNWFVWTHNSGMDLTGEGRIGQLTQTFTDMCMEGTYTCTPINDIGVGTQAHIEVSLMGEYTTIIWFYGDYISKQLLSYSECNRPNNTNSDW